MRIERFNGGEGVPGSLAFAIKQGKLVYPVGKKRVPLAEVTVRDDALVHWLECLSVSHVRKVLWWMPEEESERATRTYELTFPDTVAVPAVLRMISTLSCIEAAEPNYRITTQ